MPPKIVKEEPKDDIETMQEGEAPQRLNDYLKMMMAGTKVTRHRKKQAPKDYILKISEDLSKVFWTNALKPDAPILMINTFFLVDTQNINRGQTSVAFKKHPDKERRSTSFTVSYERVDGERMELDLVYQKEEEFIAWFFALKYLCLTSVDSYEKSPLALTLQKLWLRGDPKATGNVSKAAAKSLLNQIGIELKGDVFEEKFQSADVNQDGNLDNKELQRLVWDLKRNAVVDELWAKYTAGRNILTVDSLETFKNKEQDEMPTTQEVEELVEDFTGKKSGFLKQDFFTFLTQSNCNDAVNDLAEKPGYQNMGFRLTEYYIHAATNANEVPPSASYNCVTHINGLLRAGVRFLHLPLCLDDEVVSCCTDRSSALSRAPLRDVLEGIKLNSFALPQCCYPVIILFEIYLSIEKQKVAIKEIKDSLGFAIETAITRDTPHELKGRYCLGVFNSSGNMKATSLESGWEEITYFAYKPYIPCYDRSRDKETKKMVIMSFAPNAVERGYLDREKVSLTAKVNSTILSLIMTRYNEKTCDCVLGWAGGYQLAGCNYGIESDDYLSPIFCSGRFAQNGFCGYVLKPSTLRNPAAKSKIPKETKAKLETADDLMNSLAGGVSGKKFEPEDELDPSTGFGIDNRAAAKLIVKIISAQQIPLPAESDPNSLIFDIPDPFIEVRVDGANGPETTTPNKGDEEAPFSQRFNTQVIDNNCFCPVFNEQFNFAVKTKETAILTFRVFDKDLTDNEFLCQRSVPVSVLLTGYRCLFLRDGAGKRISSAPSIFLHIKESRIGSIDALHKIKSALEADITNVKGQIEEVERKMANNKKRMKKINESTKKDEEELKKVKTALEGWDNSWFVFNYDWFRRLDFGTWFGASISCAACGLHKKTTKEEDEDKEKEEQQKELEKQRLEAEKEEKEKERQERLRQKEATKERAKSMR